MAFFPLFSASLLRKCIRFVFSFHKNCLKRNGEGAGGGEQVNLLDFLTGTEKELGIWCQAVNPGNPCCRG
jgi:hypothetical protein